MEKDLAKHLLSVILVGSLSDGSYTGNSGSDIDLIHILKDEAPSCARGLIRDAIERTEILTENDLPIARCVYRLGELKRPFYKYDFDLCMENKDLIELPIEILRIKDSGTTLWGKDIIPLIDTPSREDIIRSREMSIAWGESEKQHSPQLYQRRIQIIENPPTRIIIQSIITAAMLDYYFCTGLSCSSKREVGKRMRKDVPGYVFQDILDLCISFRYQPTLITVAKEQWLLEQYFRWRKKRTGKLIGSTAHLVNRDGAH